MNQLFYKRITIEEYKIYFGDPSNIAAARLLGTVSAVSSGFNTRVTGWAYILPNGQTNWKAGPTMQKAAIRLAHKCGVAKDVKA